jgi:hypothetical protein
MTADKAFLGYPEAPAPWNLTGNGVVLLYHFPKDFNYQHGFMAGFQQRDYLGWLGAVMVVDYQTSAVGPYSELLFMPGLIRTSGKLGFSISKIYVSSEASKINGYQNWGIPKEQADFTFTEKPGGFLAVAVARHEQVFFEAHVKRWGWPLPVTSKLLPCTRIIQQQHQHLLLTRIAATGKIQLCSLKHVNTNPDFFPPINQLKCLAAFSVWDFRMTFPLPEQINLGSNA